MTNKYSKNTKLNNVLMAIENQLVEMGIDEVEHYYKEFKNEPDYNIVQYGNLLIYHVDIFELYRKAGYKSTENFSNEKIWNTYKKQVGYIARKMMH